MESFVYHLHLYRTTSVLFGGFVDNLYRPKTFLLVVCLYVICEENKTSKTQSQNKARRRDEMNGSPTAIQSQCSSIQKQRVNAKHDLSPDNVTTRELLQGHKQSYFSFIEHFNLHQVFPVGADQMFRPFLAKKLLWLSREQTSFQSISDRLRSGFWLGDSCPFLSPFSHFKSLSCKSTCVFLLNTTCYLDALIFALMYLCAGWDNQNQTCEKKEEKIG